ncbi:MAG: hypothetical protein LPK03_04660, partial [Pontibacter sp.]|nr:hypothetical protein [Pontibacter sp.]
GLPARGNQLQIYYALKGPSDLTPGSPGKFLMAAFVRFYAQRVTAEIYPVQLIVSQKMRHR